jgi:RecA-family ATPase
MYTWRHGVSCTEVEEVAEANESVLELLRKNSRDSKPQDAAKRQRVDMHHVPEGQRNDTLFRFASKMVGSGISRDAALEAARAEVATWDNPLPDFEIVKTVDSAYNSYEPNEQNVYSDIEPEPNDDDIVVHTLDEFEEKDIEWLIPGYVPKEQITIVAGTGGVGKTSVWVSLVADLSSGKATVFEKGSDTAQYVQRKPLHVMFFSGEDTVEHVLRKKLRQEGAILKNITTISLEDKHFEKILFGSKYLEAVVAKTKPDVIIFDPLQSFIGSKAKMADRNDIRQRMRCLIEFGSRYHTTSIIVMHTNKQQGAWGRNRMADSADLWDIARSVIMCGDTETDGVKYLSHEKCNYAKPGDTILFKTEGGHATYFMKSGLKDRDFVLATNRIKRQRSDAPDVEEAEEMIMSALMEYPDGLLTKELETLLEDGGIKTWAIRKAKANLKTRKKIKYLKTGTSDPWKVKKT